MYIFSEFLPVGSSLKKCQHAGHAARVLADLQFGLAKSSVDSVKKARAAAMTAAGRLPVEDDVDLFESIGISSYAKSNTQGRGRIRASESLKNLERWEAHLYAAVASDELLKMTNMTKNYFESAAKWASIGEPEEALEEIERGKIMGEAAFQLMVSNGQIGPPKSRSLMVSSGDAAKLRHFLDQVAMQSLVWRPSPPFHNLLWRKLYLK